jgi:signal transduction histidine kinase/HAMP domain-containing protein
VIPFRIRIMAAVLIAALAPLAAVGVLLVVTGQADPDGDIFRILLAAFVIAALLGLGIAIIVAGSLTAPLRALAAAMDRIVAGDTSTPLPALADDELGRLAERQGQLAGDLLRRNRQVARVVDAVGTYSPREGADRLVDLAIADARTAFGLIDARIVLGDPSDIPVEERVPGDPLPIRADLRAGAEPLGALVGRAPATARWDRADQDLLELFAAVVGVGLRNAELFARVADQNERLQELDAAKDDFLRGVSHNLQTPLARIRANADQLAGEQAAGGEPDRRLGIIAEQSDRLSRMVRQLLTVSRLDSGVLRPVAEVFALGPRVRRAWEALGAPGIPFTLDDRSGGWLAYADPDQVDQVIWGLLDNAVKYGGGTPISVTVELVRRAGDGADEDDAGAAPVAREGAGPEGRSMGGGTLRVRVADAGPGIAEAHRGRLFERYARGTLPTAEGTGLGLYVSRELARANGGDLVLEPQGKALHIRAAGGPVAPSGPSAATGAAFTLMLSAESPTEG